MFFVEDKKGQRKISFKHGKNPKVGRYTSCQIHMTLKGSKGKLDALLAHGLATCHPLDQYDRNVGRKLALSRALQMLFPNTGNRKRSKKTQALRQPYWTAYFAKRGGKF